MNLINIENLTKVYTERKLFDGASFSLQDGESRYHWRQWNRKDNTSADDHGGRGDRRRNRYDG